jgi:hypothetical protein
MFHRESCPLWCVTSSVCGWRAVTICRVECFSHVIVDTHCLVQPRFLPARVAIRPEPTASNSTVSRFDPLPLEELSSDTNEWPLSSLITCAISDRSTLVDQPTIMARSVSHPSAIARITNGTTKQMKNHISQKCHTRAASKPPEQRANQWSSIGL